MKFHVGSVEYFDTQELFVSIPRFGLLAVFAKPSAGLRTLAAAQASISCHSDGHDANMLRLKQWDMSTGFYATETFPAPRSTPLQRVVAFIAGSMSDTKLLPALDEFGRSVGRVICCDGRLSFLGLVSHTQGGHAEYQRIADEVVNRPF